MLICHYCGSSHSSWQCPLREASNKLSSIDKSIKSQALSSDSLILESKRHREYLSTLSDISESISDKISVLEYDINGLSDAISSVGSRINESIETIIGQNRRIINLHKSFLLVQIIQSIFLGAGLIIASIGLGSIARRLSQPKRLKAIEETEIAGKCIQLDDLDRAIKHLDRAIDTNPDIPQAWIMKVHCFLQTKRMDQVSKILQDGEKWTKDSTKDIKSKMSLTAGRYFLSKHDVKSLLAAKDKFIESLVYDSENLESAFQLAQTLFLATGITNVYMASSDVRAIGLSLLIQLGDIDPTYIRRFETDPIFGFNTKSIAEAEIILRKTYLDRLKKCVSIFDDFLYKARGLIWHDIFKENRQKVNEVLELCKRSNESVHNLAFLCNVLHNARVVRNECSDILDRFLNTFSANYRPTIKSLSRSMKLRKIGKINIKEIRETLLKY